MPDPKFLRALFGVAKAKGMSVDDLRDAASVALGKASLKSLTDAEAQQLLDGLNGRQPVDGAMSPRRREAMSAAGRKGDTAKAQFMVNGREMRMLREAATLRGWNEATLQSFIQRQLKHPIRTMADFNKVLWPIKSMNRRDNLVGPNDRPFAKPAR